MYLNSDLATEILLLLPAQSVLRFRTVCKSWCNIIDSSEFRESHLQNQSKNNVNDEDDTLFLQLTSRKLSILKADNGKSLEGFPVFQEFSYNCGSGGLSVSSPVNGLICVYNIELRKDVSPSIAIYNPFLDKIKILPLSPFCSSLDYDYSDNYVNRAGRREIGFGYDIVTKDYKVVQLILLPEGPTCVEVYSGTTNSWRKLNTNVILDYGWFYCNIKRIKSSAYNCSLVHWLVERIDYVILSFNMQTEVFKKIPYPNFENRSREELITSQVFAKDDDSLALFVFTNFSKLEVWELESRDNERSWTHVRDIVPDIPFTYGPWWPKALWKNDGVVLIEHRKEPILNFYDYSKKKVGNSYKIPNLYIELLEYKGSLISP